MGLTKLRQDIVGPSHDILNEFYRRIAKHCEDKPHSPISRFFMKIKNMEPRRFYILIALLVSIGAILEAIFLLANPT